MEFDVIELTEEEIGEFTNVQMQLLRTAQKNKNSLRHKLEQDIELFRKLVLTDGMKNSSLLDHKRAELEGEFDYQVAILAEQLQYALKVNAPYPDSGDYDESTGYIVDYSLSYTDRYIIVRDYYLAIADPAERMALYTADDVARQYLGSYYTTLYNVLYTYSQ